MLKTDTSTRNPKHSDTVKRINTSRSCPFEPPWSPQRITPKCIRPHLTLLPLPRLSSIHIGPLLSLSLLISRTPSHLHPCRRSSKLSRAICGLLSPDIPYMLSPLDLVEAHATQTAEEGIRTVYHLVPPDCLLQNTRGLWHPVRWFK